MFGFESAGEAVFTFFCFIAIGVWGMKKMLGNADPDGKVKDAATDGLARVIGRWFK